MPAGRSNFCPFIHCSCWWPSCTYQFFLWGKYHVSVCHTCTLLHAVLCPNWSCMVVCCLPRCTWTVPLGFGSILEWHLAWPDYIQIHIAEKMTRYNWTLLCQHIKNTFTWYPAFIQLRQFVRLVFEETSGVGSILEWRSLIWPDYIQRHITEQRLVKIDWHFVSIWKTIFYFTSYPTAI